MVYLSPYRRSTGPGMDDNERKMIRNNIREVYAVININKTLFKLESKALRGPENFASFTAQNGGLEISKSTSMEIIL